MTDCLTICVTGSQGFVGRRLTEYLTGLGHTVVPAVRCMLPLGIADRVESVPIWTAALDRCDCVVHPAARVHVERESASDPLQAFRLSNVTGATGLANQAAAAGVKRFVFLSSVKVNGEQTFHGQRFGALDRPSPQEPYAISKWEAEQALRRLADETGMQVVVIRPPLVYGPGVKANFASLVYWLGHGIPLPLGSVNNLRSLVALDNLCDLIATCIWHPAAANNTWMVSDGEDLSTSELLRRMGAALKRPVRLLPVPPSLLKWGAILAGQHEIAQRLLQSLQVDIQPTRQLLGWSPPLSVDEGLQHVARHVRK